MNVSPLFLHALSPLHAGTGQGVGVIDLPIAREIATALPYLPGSSIKGTLRDCVMEEKERQIIFGPPTEYAADNAGSAQFTDARILLFTVRSLAGTFAWLTSPYLIQRFIRDMNAAQSLDTIPTIDAWDAATNTTSEMCKIASGSKLKLSGNLVVLEDLDFHAQEDAQVTNLAAILGQYLFRNHEDHYWQTALTERLCVVRDDVLNFLLLTATEVIARIKLKDDTKTVDSETGALWYEEALPTETILYSLVVATPVKKANYRKPKDKGWEQEAECATMSAEDIFRTIQQVIRQPLQFGGKATIGRGICRAILVNPELSSSKDASTKENSL